MGETTTHDVREVAIEAIRTDGADLVREHWEQHGRWGLDPDWDLCATLQSAGRLVAVAAYRDGQMIGYAITLVVPSLNDRKQVLGSTAALYVAKASRKGGPGREIVEASRAAVARLGATTHLIHAAPGSDLERLVKAWDYDAIETVFAKELS